MSMILKEKEDYIKTQLENEYCKDDNEWVDIYITPLNRIDITIINNNASLIDEEEVEKKSIEILSKLSNLKPNDYSIGFVDIYTPDEAEELSVKRIQIKKEPITWSDTISLNNQRIEREKRTGSHKIISFYSYKGGVGRTIAMIQMGYLLAKEGKKVLLVDLDIEAPSLHQIFKNEVANETSGVKNGLVDYLFEKLMNSGETDDKIRLTDLFCEVPFSESIDGKMYVLPATTQLDSQYIFKLNQLQSKVIYENKYLEDLLYNLGEEIGIDTILIDSRTGLNQWGAFSLLGFADQIVFIAYPNVENIEGINEVIKSMRNVGLENYVVAMSKIVASSEGQKFSNALFNKLDIDQEEPINIAQNDAIAMAEKYPVTDILDPYAKLSLFVLDNERIDFNKNYLENYFKNNDRNDLIKKMFRNETSIIRTESESKALQDTNNNIIVYNNQSNIDNLLTFSNRLSNRFFRFLNRKRSISIWNGFNESDIIQSLLDKASSNWNSNWMALTLFLINKQLDESNKEQDKSTPLFGVKELLGKDIEYYINYLSNFNLSQLVEKFKLSISSEIGRKFSVDINDDDNEIKGNIHTKVVSQSVLIFLSIETIVDKVSGFEWLLGLTDVIKFYKKNIPDLRIIVMVSKDTYSKLEKNLNELKGNISFLDWSEEDVRALISSNIDINIFEDYQKEFIRNSQLINGLEASNQEIFYDMEDDVIDEFDEFDEFDESNIIDLIIGIRKKSDKYSESMLSWIYKKINTLSIIDSKTIMSIIKKSVEIELNNKISLTDRLISIESLEKAFAEREI